MKANTAICFLACSVAFAALLDLFPLYRKNICLSCTLLVLVFAGATTCEYLFQCDLHIDQLLFTDLVQRTYPGRMAPITAVNLLLVTLALANLAISERNVRLFQAIATVVGFSALLAITGYLYGVPVLYGSMSYTAMALHTGVGFLLLSLAMLLARPDEGFMAVIVGGGPDSALARIFLPASILGPLFLGLAAINPRFNFGDYRFGIVLLVLACNVLFVFITWLLASRIRGIELARIATEHARQGGAYLLQNISDSSGDVIFAKDRQGKFIFANAAALTLIGQPLDRVLGQTDLEILEDKSAAQAVTVNDQRVMQSCIAEDFEEAVPMPDGTHRMWFSRKMPYVGASGEVIGILGVSRDITARKRTEEALQESEAAFSTVANLVPQFVWIGTSDGSNVYFNQRWVEYTGLTLEESHGRGWTKALHPDEQVAAGEAWNRAVASGQQFIVECRLRAADGTYRWFLMRAEPLRDAAGNPTRWFGTCTDIDDLKKNAQALTAHRRLLETVVNYLPCAIALVRGDDLTYQLVNAAYDAIAPGKNMLHRRVSEVWPEIPQLEQLCRRVLKTGRPVYEHDQPFTVAGSSSEPDRLAYFSWSMHRASLPGEEGWSLLVAGWETTQRKLAEESLRSQSEQLRALASRLQQVREDERTVVARDLHDHIGQLLTAVKIDVTWLDRNLPAREPKLLERLNATVDLINDGVRSIRRICSGLRPGILDDAGLAAAIEWQAHEFATRTGISCQVFVPPTDPPLDTDRATAIFRIFQESLTNVTRHANARTVHASLLQEERCVLLTVEDDGKGFRKEEVSDSLGILGMMERAQACGGDLQFSGGPGRGTTVTLRVPLHGSSPC